MNEVKAIKDKEQIKKLREALNIGSQAKRNVFLLDFGLLCPARISDLLQLKVADVRGVSHISIKEAKTKKTNKFVVNPHLAKIISTYTEGMLDDDWLFPSRKGNNPIGRIQAYRALRKGADWAGLNIEIGCHSLRKTFGYHYYLLDPTRNLALLQKIFKHSSSAVTLRYIGIEQDDIDESINDLSF